MTIMCRCSGFVARRSKSPDCGLARFEPRATSDEPRQQVLRLVTAAALVLGLASIAAAQDEKVPPDKLPQKVAATVKAKFPGAIITTATKTLENGEVIYDIEMTKSGRKHEIDLRADGSIVNFENEIAVKDLPRAVVDAVNASHPKSTIKEVMEVMVVKGGKDTIEEYEVVIVTADKKEIELAVSPDGKTIK
jgi:hypothetical protein